MLQRDKKHSIQIYTKKCESTGEMNKFPEEYN
jgi:translation initiation factor 2 beta subunit (eIF-2beta)/eIF-5